MWSPHPDVICQSVGDDYVLVHLGTKDIFSLNRTGVRIWQLLQEGVAVPALAARLHAEFDADESLITGEVERLLEELAARRLIAETDAG